LLACTAALRSLISKPSNAARMSNAWIAASRPARHPRALIEAAAAAENFATRKDANERHNENPPSIERETERLHEMNIKFATRAKNQ
jgi:hypothetical protein